MITTEQISKLRERTGAGILACKKALEETGGDIDLAIDLLRKKGEVKAAEKGDRETSEGTVVISGNTILSLLSETDFVARNEKFVAFANELCKTADKDGIDAMNTLFDTKKADIFMEMGENVKLGKVLSITQKGHSYGYIHTNNKAAAIVCLDTDSPEKARDIAMHVVAMSPMVANIEDMPADVMAHEKEIYAAQLQAEGKTGAMVEGILAGKLKKFAASQALSEQPFVKDPSKTVAAYAAPSKILGFVRVSI